jgi:hypothetical protein
VQVKSSNILLTCLRETVRYALAETHRIEQTSSQICRVFETGLLVVSDGCPPQLTIPVAKYIPTSSSFSLFEISWFTKISFNLARVLYKESCSQSVIQLLSYVLGVGNIEPGSLSLRAPPGASLTNDDRRPVEEVEKRQATSKFALAISHTTEA